MRNGKRALLLAALLTLQTSCGWFGGSGGDKSVSGRPAPHFRPGFNLFTPEQDIELGRQSAQQISREVPIINDAEVAAYVRRLGEKMAARAPGHDFPYQFQVVGTRDINAFALPGGFVFINAGTIASARNEGELAGVIAHEIAHVALRHGTNQASKAYIAQAGLGVLGAIAGDSPEMGEVINAVGGAGANILFLKFGRTAETQADLEGARIMAAAGYDPRDMARFFETLEDSAGGERTPEMLSDHPDPGNRIASINEVLPSLNVSKNPTRDTQEFQQIKARFTGRSALRSSSEPARVGPRDPNDIEPAARPAPPSTRLDSYSARDKSFSLSYPDNWDVLSTEGGAGLMIFAPPGAYGERDGAVYATHGVFAATVDPPAGDLRQATELFVQEQIRANPDFRVQRGPQQVSFGGGRAAYATVVSGPSTVTGVVEVDIIYTTAAADGRLFYLITMAPEDEYDRYHPAFEQIVRSLQFAR